MMTQLEQRFFEAATRYFRNKEIDWEQRRYEIARDAMCAFLSNSCPNVYGGGPKRQATDAVDFADALIEELKK